MGCESTTRELAQRLSGNDEILLLWKPLCEQVEIAVRDVETGIEFHLEVAPGNALDAFHHPYAYAAALGKYGG
jgi:hypothetical protein